MTTPEPSDGEPTVRLGKRTALLLVAFVLVFVGALAGPTLWAGWQERQLQKHGTDATATIVALQDTRDEVNDNSVIQLTIDVEAEGREPYRAQIVTPLTALDLQTYRVGTRVRVRYDPDDPSKVALVGPLR
jgi:hypothetical protein